MEFPIEIQMLINDYARPMTRPDWRKGNNILRTLRLHVGGGYQNWNPEYYCYIFRDQIVNKKNYKIYRYN
jgi:hypothetical protein